MASVITGGPGTGKTTIINAIIYTLTRLGLSYKLAAPTGRAAKRMSLACGEDASTIHRLLEVGFANGIMEYKRNSSNPLECDVVIIDEMSMVDLPLFWRLLNAMLPDELRLIMVGDKDQLPSVSPGNVLNDIISTDVVTVSMLSNVFRQEEGTSIAPNAQRINRGLAPEAKAGDNSFEIVELSGQPEIADYIINYISQNESILQAMMQSEKVQIISPLKKGESGVISLNKKLQELINPEDVGKDEIEQFEYTLREGDKIMQTRNNYEASWENVITHETGEGVFNGDIGIIENINEYAGEITLLFDNEKRVKYTHAKDIEGITLAYAITIHKSQGSEFDYVIMPLFPTAPSFLTRNLLYTAVTRAKKKVAIIGEKRVIDHMVGNNQTSQRNSALRERIIELIRSPNFMSRR
jgi:exodeoxyribonuclease V alpha subunit